MARKAAHILLVSGLMILSVDLFAQKENPPANTKQKTPVKIIEYIVGSWKLTEAYKGKKNVTALDSASHRTIDFNREGRFISRSNDVKTDSGAYRVNEEHSTLYVQSDWRDVPPLEWSIRFEENRMTLQPKDRSPQQESERYVYVRTGIKPKMKRGSQPK